MAQPGSNGVPKPFVGVPSTGVCPGPNTIMCHACNYPTGGSQTDSSLCNMQDDVVSVLKNTANFPINIFQQEVTYFSNHFKYDVPMEFSYCALPIPWCHFGDNTLPQNLIKLLPVQHNDRLGVFPDDIPNPPNGVCTLPPTPAPTRSPTAHPTNHPTLNPTPYPTPKVFIAFAKR